MQKHTLTQTNYSFRQGENNFNKNAEKQNMHKCLRKTNLESSIIIVIQMY